MILNLQQTNSNCINISQQFIFLVEFLLHLCFFIVYVLIVYSSKHLLHKTLEK